MGIPNCFDFLGCFMFLNGSLEFILELWKPWVLDWPNGHCGKFWNFFLDGLF
jgi:hypothetical protein